ncbi:RNA metabolism protein [Lithospermum erythrorhizon]|uniref:RNA metabolism protein n=1 Tax=Lithospermum erythrorhizon TaxID=34254 RepID=A0AAV3Q599_LITER
MGSREKDQTAPHQLSSLVVRPSETTTTAAAGENGGSDYEPGEVRRNDSPSYGYRVRTGSASPVRRRNEDHRYSPGFGHSGGPVRNNGFGGRRSMDRYRDYSLPYGPGRNGSRFVGRGSGRPRPFRGGSAAPNNPNVKPRDGDWFCSDPSCGNLNFARRESCNNCKRPRHSPAGIPRRGYPGSPPPGPRRMPGPLRDSGPGRMMGDYRSPPRGWARDGPRDFRSGHPFYPRREGRFPDPPMRERRDFPGDDFRGRDRLERPMPPDWGHRNQERDNFFRERNSYDRRPLSPLPPAALPPRGHWDRGIRERSRSPLRGEVPPKDHHRDMYMERGRDDRHEIGRGSY